MFCQWLHFQAYAELRSAGTCRRGVTGPGHIVGTSTSGYQTFIAHAVAVSSSADQQTCISLISLIQKSVSRMVCLFWISNALISKAHSTDQT